jgi:hypothetical protein
MPNLFYLLVPPVKQSRTPIPVPSTLKRSSSERSITPVGRATIVPPPKAQSPLATATKSTPPVRSASQASEIPIEPLAKGMFHSALASSHYWLLQHCA